jgi:hypothetical protein
LPLVRESRHRPDAGGRIMSDSHDTAVYPGLWECGHCQAITGETHFYMDRATGEMGHAADPYMRERRDGKR